MSLPTADPQIQFHQASSVSVTIPSHEHPDPTEKSLAAVGIVQAGASDPAASHLNLPPNADTYHGDVALFYRHKWEEEVVKHAETSARLNVTVKELEVARSQLFTLRSEPYSGLSVLADLQKALTELKYDHDRLIAKCSHLESALSSSTSEALSAKHETRKHQSAVAAAVSETEIYRKLYEKAVARSAELEGERERYEASSRSVGDVVLRPSSTTNHSSPLGATTAAAAVVSSDLIFKVDSSSEMTCGNCQLLVRINEMDRASDLDRIEELRVELSKSESSAQFFDSVHRQTMQQLSDERTAHMQTAKTVSDLERRLSEHRHDHNAAQSRMRSYMRLSEDRQRMLLSHAEVLQDFAARRSSNASDIVTTAKAQVKILVSCLQQILAALWLSSQTKADNAITATSAVTAATMVPLHQVLVNMDATLREYFATLSEPDQEGDEAMITSPKSLLSPLFSPLSSSVLNEVRKRMGLYSSALHASLLPAVRNTTIATSSSFEVDQPTLRQTKQTVTELKTNIEGVFAGYVKTDLTVPDSNNVVLSNWTASEMQRIISSKDSELDNLHSTIETLRESIQSEKANKASERQRFIGFLKKMRSLVSEDTQSTVIFDEDSELKSDIDDICELIYRQTVAIGNQLSLYQQIEQGCSVEDLIQSASVSVPNVASNIPSEDSPTGLKMNLNPITLHPSIPNPLASHSPIPLQSSDTQNVSYISVPPAPASLSIQETTNSRHHLLTAVSMTIADVPPVEDRTKLEITKVVIQHIAKIRTLEAEIQRWKEEVQEMRDELMSRANIIRRLGGQLDLTEKQHDLAASESESMIRQLQADNKLLDSKLTELSSLYQKNMDAGMSKVQELQHEIKEMKAERAALILDLESSQRSERHIHEETRLKIQNLGRESQRLQLERDTLRAALDTASNVSTTTTEQLKLDNVRLSLKVSEMEGLHRDLTLAFDQERRTLKREIEDVKIGMQSEVQNVRDEAAAHSKTEDVQRISDMVSMKSRYEGEISKLTLVNEQLAGTLDRQAVELSHAMRDIKALKGDLEASLARTTELENELLIQEENDRDLVVEKGLAKSMILSRNETIKGLEATIERSRRECNTLTTEVSDLTDIKQRYSRLTQLLGVLLKIDGVSDEKYVEGVEQLVGSAEQLRLEIKHLWSQLISLKGVAADRGEQCSQLSRELALAIEAKEDIISKLHATQQQQIEERAEWDRKILLLSNAASPLIPASPPPHHQQPTLLPPPPRKSSLAIDRSVQTNSVLTLSTSAMTTPVVNFTRGTQSELNESIISRSISATDSIGEISSSTSKLLASTLAKLSLSEGRVSILEEELNLLKSDVNRKERQEDRLSKAIEAEASPGFNAQQCTPNVAQVHTSNRSMELNHSVDFLSGLAKSFEDVTGAQRELIAQLEDRLKVVTEEKNKALASSADKKINSTVSSLGSLTVPESTAKEIILLKAQLAKSKEAHIALTHALNAVKQRELDLNEEVRDLTRRHEIALSAVHESDTARAEVTEQLSDISAKFSRREQGWREAEVARESELRRLEGEIGRLKKTVSESEERCSELERLKSEWELAILEMKGALSKEEEKSRRFETDLVKRIAEVSDLKDELELAKRAHLSWLDNVQKQLLDASTEHANLSVTLADVKQKLAVSQEDCLQLKDSHEQKKELALLAETLSKKLSESQAELEWQRSIQQQEFVKLTERQTTATRAMEKDRAGWLEIRKRLESQIQALLSQEVTAASVNAEQVTHLQRQRVQLEIEVREARDALRKAEIELESRQASHCSFVEARDAQLASVQVSLEELKKSILAERERFETAATGWNAERVRWNREVEESRLIIDRAEIEKRSFMVEVDRLSNLLSAREREAATARLIMVEKIEEVRQEASIQLEAHVDRERAERRRVTMDLEESRMRLFKTEDELIQVQEQLGNALNRVSQMEIVSHKPITSIMSVSVQTSDSSSKKRHQGTQASFLSVTTAESLVGKAPLSPLKFTHDASVNTDSIPFGDDPLANIVTEKTPIILKDYLDKGSEAYQDDYSSFSVTSDQREVIRITRELAEVQEISSSSRAITLQALDQFYSHHHHQQILRDDNHSHNSNSRITSWNSNVPSTSPIASSSSSHPIKCASMWSSNNEKIDSVQSMRAATAASVVRTAKMVEGIVDERTRRKLSHDAAAVTFAGGGSQA